MNPAAPSGNGQPKIGVYVCHCGTNIAATVDVEAVRDYAEGLPGVAVAQAYKYMCSDPGQELIKEDIRANGLDRVVVASCSPSLHEDTFRSAVGEGGLNPYFFQMVNIREHDSWVHTDMGEATGKAKDLVRAAVHRVRFHKPLERTRVPVNPAVMVVGGGIAGIHAALDRGQRRQARLPGRARAVHRRAHGPVRQDLPHPRLRRLHPHPEDDGGAQQSQHHPVDDGRGRPGRRLRGQLHGDGAPQAALHRRGRLRRLPGVHRGLRLQGGQDPRRVQPRPEQAQADLHPLPAGGAAARGHRPGGLHRVQDRKCKKTCVEACADRNAIDFTQTETFDEVEVGTIILATGFKTFDPKRMPSYGYGVYPNVYTALEVERLVNASGPTEGHVTLRDGRTPKAVGIIHCVGSRDENTNQYCSRVCCMYSLKLAHLVKEKTGAEVYNFYIDMRAPGKGIEEFYNRVAEEGVHFIRGKVADVYPEGGDTGRVILQAEDTLIGRVRKIPVDMVVLAIGLEPRPDAEDVRRMFNISCAGGGFFLERHPKLAPVSTFTDGIFLAGACQGPKDIPDTVAQAGAAAAEALALIDRGYVEMEPNTAYVVREECSGCKTCIPLCPYTAITRVDGKAEINEVLCKGCGTCVAACPSGSIRQNLFEDEEIFEEIEGVLAHV